MRRKIPLMVGTFALACFFAIGGVSAFFTDRIDLSSVLKVKTKAVSENCIDMNFFDEKNSVGVMPGDDIEMSPMVTNVNGENCYVFAEVSIPLINSEGTQKPVFSYQKSNNWHLVTESVAGTNKTEVYCYGKTTPELLSPGESTDNLFSKVTFLSLPGNEELSDKNVSIGIKAILVLASKIKFESNYKDSKNLYNLVLADEKETISKAYVKENVIGIGKMKVEIKDSSDDENDKSEGENNKSEGENDKLDDENDKKDDGSGKEDEVVKDESPGENTDEKKEEIVVENKGDVNAVVFLKVRSLKTPLLKPDVSDLIYLGKDNDEYVYGLTTVLKEGENTDDLMDKLEVDGILETKILSIQAANLTKDGVPINTEKDMTRETLIDIYEILREGSEGFFTDEDIITEEEFTKGKSLIKIEEVFDNSRALRLGENNYEKRVTVRNVGEASQFVKIKLGYSNEEIEDKIFVYTGIGEFVKISELKNSLNTGWEYLEDDGESYFVYTNKLKPNDVTSPLFTHIRIVFDNVEDVKDFDLFVEAEGRKEAYV